MKLSGIFTGAFGVCLVIAVVVGIASAAVGTPHFFVNSQKNDTASGKGNGASGEFITHIKQQGVDNSLPKAAIHNAEMTSLNLWLNSYRDTNDQNTISKHSYPISEKILSKLEEQGVDVSVPKAAIQKGHKATLKSWILGKIISKLEAEGVDVSVPKAAIQNGDMAALQTWVEEYLDEQGVDVSVPKDALQKGDKATLNSWILGKIISKLEAEGVDVSVPKAPIQNGDLATLQTWVEEYLDEQGVDVSVPKAAIQNGDMAALQTWVEEYFEEQGVDISVPKSAIQNGDKATLKTWLNEFRASHMG
jgi:Asp-tRNA(Asn)/Glu-tRNA(Gln) amidotransferase B subunit